MVDDSRKTPDNIEKELSVGRFAAQQGRTIGFTFGGAAIGAGIGFLLTKKAGLSEKVGKWFSQKATAEMANNGIEAGAELAKKIEANGKAALMIVSGGIGLLLGSLASQYEHWIKVERERLSVQEINKDVASIMEKRVQFEETLDKQHSIVKKLLDQRGTAPDKSMSEKVRDSQENATTAVRGNV